MGSYGPEISTASEAALRRSILDTAREFLVRDGYASLSMRKIARSIGYSATSIYLHFDGKDQLVHALITEGMSKLAERLRPLFDGPSQEAEKAVRRICQAYVRFGLANPGYYEIMYVLHPESLSRYPEVRYRNARTLIENIADVLDRGMKKGRILLLDPLISANILWSQMHGLVSLIQSRRFDRALQQDVLIENAIESAVRSLFVSPESVRLHE